MGEKKKDASTIRLPSLHSHSGASSRKGDRERRERGGGREGGGCCSEKNDAAAVLGGCRLGRDREGEREREKEEGGREKRGRLAQSAVSDVGFTAPIPSGALLRFTAVLNTPK